MTSDHTINLAFKRTPAYADAYEGCGGGQGVSNNNHLFDSKSSDIRFIQSRQDDIQLGCASSNITYLD